MIHVVERPGIYGFVEPGGDLWFWDPSCQTRRRAEALRRGPLAFGVQSWPIWWTRSNRRPDGRITVNDPAAGSRNRNPIPVRFGEDTDSYEMMADIQKAIDERVWWTSTRPWSQEAFYMPAMPRDALIELVTDLEDKANRGRKILHKIPIGVWIRRVWASIEMVEMGS